VKEKERRGSVRRRLRGSRSASKISD